MLTIAMRRENRFDRTIQVRNGVECGAAALLTVLFSIMAWKSPHALACAGNLVVAASGVWIAFYMLRYGREKSLAADRSLADYQHALLLKYQHQIRLLKNVKYWYLLPPYIGLLLASAGRVMAQTAQGRAGWPELIAVIVYTAVFGFVWWLNERYGVRKLKSDHARLVAEMDVSAGE